MTAPALSPVDSTTDDEDLTHVFCSHRDLTWCGQDASTLTLITADRARVGDICRTCLLAIEMLTGPSCPVCGCRVDHP